MEIRTEEMLTSEQRRANLSALMNHYKCNSWSEFARMIGVSAQNLNSWIARGTYNVELLAVRLPEISGDWLLTGEPPMLKKDRADTPKIISVPATGTELQKALSALTEEQKMTQKALAQSDQLLTVMQSLSASLKRLTKDKGQE